MPMATRHLFAGANSPQGFVSFYDQITPRLPRKLYILKGGPGLGKSTFMRRISERLDRAGLLVEQIHCSADCNSLDGVYVPSLGIGLMDGTAPHVVDPKLPGAYDTIVHLGDHWNEDRIRSHREEIAKTSAECTFRFHRAYDCLRAAKGAYDEQVAYYGWQLDTDALQRTAVSLANEYLPVRPEGQTGDGLPAGSTVLPDRLERHLLAGGITPEGPKNYLTNLMGFLPERLVFQGPVGSGKSELVRALADEARRRGHAVEYFHCPFRTDRVEHAIIHSLGLGLISSSEPHLFEAQPGDRVIDTAAWVRSGTRFSADLLAAKEQFASAYQRAVDQLEEAHRVHDILETYYVPYIDWEAVDRRREAVWAEIETMLA